MKLKNQGQPKTIEVNRDLTIDLNENHRNIIGRANIKQLLLEAQLTK